MSYIAKPGLVASQSPEASTSSATGNPPCFGRSATGRTGWLPALTG